MKVRVKNLVRRRKGGLDVGTSPETAQGDLIASSQLKPDLVMAFVGAVGVQLPKVEKLFEERIKKAGFSVHTIKISDEIIGKLKTTRIKPTKETPAARLKRLMDGGNEVRRRAENDGILAMGAAAKIAEIRRLPTTARGNAYFIHSLKHPEEVQKLREIYPRGFYLVGVHADPDRRKTYLTEDLGLGDEEAENLMRRDLDEKLDSGQKLIDTFHLSDFFVRIAGDDDRLKKSIWRIVETMFGSPHITPTFGEYAMYLAFAASLRSGDLSRQVGAVLARKGEILATGSNDCPSPGGGLYWPEFNPQSKAMEDVPDGRDFKRGFDSNKRAQREMVSTIIESFRNQFDVDPTALDGLRKILRESPIRDLTEFGRVVHAEMEALLSCGRNGISTLGTTLYGTTFPCHNCAKHIIAAGVERVVFIEPYMKSKAIELHYDAIEISYTEGTENGEKRNEMGKKKVQFEPFIGVGPRRFFDLFSMNLGAGTRLARKKPDGDVVTWKLEKAPLRIEMHPKSYLEIETDAAKQYTALSKQR